MYFFIHKHPKEKEDEEEEMEEDEGEREECNNLGYTERIWKEKQLDFDAKAYGEQQILPPRLTLEAECSFTDSWSYPIHISINIDLRYLARQMVLSPQFHNDECSLETVGFGIKSPQ